jgi:hypothetical protein
MDHEYLSQQRDVIRKRKNIFKRIDLKETQVCMALNRIKRYRIHCILCNSFHYTFI